MRLGRGFLWPMLLLALASMIIFLCGLASVQWNCHANMTPAAGRFGVFGVSDTMAFCPRVYRFYWFAFAFVVATLLGLLVTSFMAGGLMTSRPFWVGMLAISTILMMIASETFLAFTDASEASGFGAGQWLFRIRTTAAGAIMSVAFLIFLMMAVGTDWRTDGTATGTTRGGIVDKPVSNVGPGVTAV